MLIRQTNKSALLDSNHGSEFFQTLGLIMTYVPIAQRDRLGISNTKKIF